VIRYLIPLVRPSVDAKTPRLPPHHEEKVNYFALMLSGLNTMVIDQEALEFLPSQPLILAS
jgi:hypothetical protein